MPSIGFSELLVILGIALLLFGNRLPQVGKALGEGIRDFKRGLRDENSNSEKTDMAAAQSAPQNVGPQAQAISQATTNLAQGLSHASRNPEHIIDVQHVNK